MSISHAMWSCHNGILHHHMELPTRILEAETLHTQIQAQFALGPQDLLSSNQPLLSHQSLAQVLCYPIQGQQQWLSAITVACTHGLQQWNSKLQQIQDSMTAILCGPPTLP